MRLPRTLSAALVLSCSLGVTARVARSQTAPAVVAPSPAPAAVVAPTPSAPTAQSNSTALVDNVLLITIDSLRADMPWAGYARAIAPNLTAFAARSVNYSHAYSVSSYTSMSVGGMLASLLPSEIPRDGSFFNVYPPRRTLFFPELLQRAGIHTLATQAHFYFRRGYSGFEQGFDRWDMLPDLHPDPTTDRDITGDRHEQAAERLLGDPQHTGRRFFAWFHFMDPHDQYLPHAGIGPYGRTNRDRYDAEVTWTDRQVGRLLDFVARQPWAARTAIIITSDHGESFGEHHHFRHGFELWQHLVRIPMLVSIPGGRARVINNNRSAIDLAPTILALYGLPPEPTFRGVSLVDELRGGATPDRDVWVDLARTTINDRRRALVHGNHKVLSIGEDRRFLVFDVAADPGEEHPLAETDRATHDAMVARYRAALGSLHEVPASNLPTTQR